MDRFPSAAADEPKADRLLAECIPRTAVPATLRPWNAPSKGGDHLEEIERNQQALDSAGHWGVPTLVFEGEPLFGQDRINTLRWHLEGQGLRRDRSWRRWAGEESRWSTTA